MKEYEEDELKKLLQRAMPRVAADAEPERDLWPAVLSRLDAAAAPPWFDWALLGGLAGFVAMFPAVIPLFLYYL
jgi:hypothetical protein